MKLGKHALWSIGVVLLGAVPAMAGPCRTEARITPGNQVVDETTFGAATVVMLNGQSSKDTATFFWTQTGGPPVTLDDPTSAKPKFSAPDVGPAGAVLTFELTAKGCSPEQTSRLATTINVTNVVTNRAPTASVTVANTAPPYAVFEGMAVTLDGSGSSDPDGDILSYAWNQTGGTPVTLTPDATGQFATFTAPPEQYPNGETLTFRLSVSDGSLGATTEVGITVQSVNQPPSVILSCPAAVNEGAPVTLDGSGSSDPDAGQLLYQWSQLQGVPNADLVAVDLTGPGLTFVAPHLTSPTYDTMTFGLRVVDNGNLSGTETCSVKVLDVTPPRFTGGTGDLKKEATSAAGAVVTFDPTARDDFDGDVAVTCTPESGSQFGLGTNPVTCGAADAAGNRVEVTFTVTVEDTTPPVIAPHDPVTAEATGPAGAEVPYTSPETSDAVDGTGTATCAPASGSTFPLGETAVTCTAADMAGNAAIATTFTVTVVDTTPPALTLTGPAGPVEGDTLGGATVSYTASAGDLVDGAVEVTCDRASGSLFPVGATTVTCSAVDTRGNRGAGSFTVTVVDTTPPVITFGGTIADGASFVFGSTPPVSTCTASDIVSGDVPCAVSGYDTRVGTHPLTATATDKAGNTATATQSYTVLPWTLSGFYRPVDMNATNTVKGGSTVPMKFEVFAGATELTTTASIKSIQLKSVGCISLSSSEDPVEFVETGGTQLRYDTTAGQFIFNWQTPKLPGTCYVVTVTTQDDSTLSANFKLK